MASVISSTVKKYDTLPFHSISATLIVDAVLELSNRTNVLTKDIKCTNISSEQIWFKIFVEWDNSAIIFSHPLGEYFVDNSLMQKHDSSLSWLVTFISKISC
jgi:hypothetical protein